MSQLVVCPSRRMFLGAFALGAAAFTTRGLFAEELTRIKTPRQTEGPFYPDRLPLDTDNDLLIVNDSITPAVGDVTHLSGTILDAKGDASKITIQNVFQSNGVIHVIDSVLLPS